MTRVELKGINMVCARLANGARVTYYYHRSTKLRLEGAPGSPEFVASWQAAEASIKSTDRSAGTLGAWVSGYRASDAFTGLAEATRKDYAKQIAKIEDEFADLPLAALADPRVRATFLDWRDRLAKRSARQADYAVQVLRLILAWAVNRGELAINPLSKPGRKYQADRAEKIWQPDDVDAFILEASAGLALAMVLARDTGQRQGDLLRLSWTAYDGAIIRVRQSKTGARVAVPVTAELKRILDATPRRATTILTTPAGLPWKVDHFRHEWRAVTLTIGRDGLRFNDLRGTTVTRLADSECTPAEIAAITGHSQRSIASILDTYQARTPRQASMAIAKLERRLSDDIAKGLQNGATANKKGSS